MPTFARPGWPPDGQAGRLGSAESFGSGRQENRRPEKAVTNHRLRLGRPACSGVGLRAENSEGACWGGGQ